MPNEQDPTSAIPELDSFEEGQIADFEAINDEWVIPDYGVGLETHKESYKAACERIDVESQEHQLNVERQMLPERKKYALLIFIISVIWLIFIGVCVWKAGRQYLMVSDSVLIALITTTTVNVLGLFYIVARWLFPNKHD